MLEVRRFDEETPLDLQSNPVAVVETDRFADTRRTRCLGPSDKAEIVSRFLVELALWDQSRKQIRDAIAAPSAPRSESSQQVQQALDNRAKRAKKLDTWMDSAAKKQR